MSEDRPQDAPDDIANSSELRKALRHSLPAGVSASLKTLLGRIAYVTVNDLSRSGACVVRRGGIEIEPDEEVILDFSDMERNQHLSLPSQVQWVKEKNYNTQIGLRFLNGPLLPGTMLDDYLDQPLLGRGGA